MPAATLETTPEFFSCDWGTTSFRMRRVRMADGRITAEIEEPVGAKALLVQCDPKDGAAREKVFGNFLRDRLEALLSHAFTGSTVSVVVSGMASSSVGWREVPYAGMPFPLDGSSIKRELVELPLSEGRSAQVHLVSGVASATEMMRGEETEIVGLFAEGRHQEIARDGLVIMPGTHSKQVRICEGQIIGLHSYMTGELFEMLATHSLLRLSVESETKITLDDPVARAAFLEGVDLVRSVGLPRSLFQTRTRAVLSGVNPSENRWFLSGLLIGAEMTDLANRETAVPILLAATEATSLAYQLAMDATGLSSRTTVVPSEQMRVASLQGHRVILTAC